jgi:hypothetical protein
VRPFPGGRCLIGGRLVWLLAIEHDEAPRATEGIDIDVVVDVGSADRSRGGQPPASWSGGSSDAGARERGRSESIHGVCGGRRRSGPRGSDGRGVRWEARLIRDRFYAHQPAGLREVLPVVLPGCSAGDIPLWLGPAAAHYVVSEYTVAGAERLLGPLRAAVRDRAAGRPRPVWLDAAGAARVPFRPAADRRRGRAGRGHGLTSTGTELKRQIANAEGSPFCVLGLRKVSRRDVRTAPDGPAGPGEMPSARCYRRAGGRRTGRR